MLDNSFGDSLIDKIALVAKLKSCASHVECDGHDPVGLGIEFVALSKNCVMDMTRPPLSVVELYADPACQSGDGL